jgi:hypothetical protein
MREDSCRPIAVLRHIRIPARKRPLAAHAKLTTMGLWVYIRFSAILLVVIGACFEPLGPRAQPPIGWIALLVIFAFCPIALVIVLGFQRVNPHSAGTWHRPSWTTNLFNFREPIQFFYFGAFVSMAQGVIILCRIAVTGAPFYVEALVPSAMGLGIWLGVQMTVALFRSKFDHST